MDSNTSKTTPASANSAQVSKKASRSQLARDLNGIPAEFADLIDVASRKIIRAAGFGYVRLLPSYNDSHVFLAEWRLSIGFEDLPKPGPEEAWFQTYDRPHGITRHEAEISQEFLDACARIRANRKASK